MAGSPVTHAEFGENFPSANEALALHENFRNNKKIFEKAEVNNSSESNLSVLEDKVAYRRPYPLMLRFINDSLLQNIQAHNGLAWRLLDFYSNHFSVSSNGGLMTFIAPTLEREAIAPQLFGKFEDMLLAVMKHPAMLVYLNNERSYGPNSKIGRKRPDKGLNENLAREVLELHTLGVNGGYNQTDVIELAKAISGWSFDA